MRKVDEGAPMMASGPSTSGRANSHVQSAIARPIHMQRLDQLLDMNSFTEARRTEKLLPLSTSSDEENDQIIVDDNSTSPNNSDIMADCNDGKYFIQGVQDLERSWLSNICSEELPTAVADNDEQINGLLKMFKMQKRVKKKTKENQQVLEENMYYGSGLIANYDKYPEHKKAMQAKYPRKPTEVRKKDLFVDNAQLDLTSPATVTNAGACAPIAPPLLGFSPLTNTIATTTTTIARKHQQAPGNVACPAAAAGSAAATSAAERRKQFKDEEAKRKYEEAVTVKRRRLLMAIYKKEVGKQQRTKVNRHKEALISVKKLALQCQKVIRQKAIQSQRACKELPWRMKRLTRENQAYWRRSKRLDREKRRKQERAAEEQRKMDHELTEVRRQQRKLNFLITQTELYAHFMSRKVAKDGGGGAGGEEEEEEARILRQLDEGEGGGGASVRDDYSSDAMKSKAIRNAQAAFHSEHMRTQAFSKAAAARPSMAVVAVPMLDTVDGEFAQPAIFTGTLKAYQLRGMNWLASLYDQGISGILADEMGLGKTVQSIAFLSHLAESQDVWGPFLIICPASTLHNWQQEFAKFVPILKVVPYWGNPADRKILRQFWFAEGIHTRDSSYHVVITSYQIVISDVKYFNRIKWQYMILDEAQAIKSTSSMRWKILLGFNCRNRLLLSGTPIQNSMAELWALLHFIMPTLFDSHEEFNEWFSKDIESHAENKTGIDEKHLSRLHLILKPFMLRRIKKDVENELSDKIEVMVYCPLTARQRLMYMALKQKIRIEDLLHYTVGGGGDSHSVDKNFTSNLMNLVMQFRKVCNHPELFERRDAKSPICILACIYIVPRLIYEYNPRMTKHFTVSKHFNFTPKYIQDCMVGEDESSLFKIISALRISVADFTQIMSGDIDIRWRNHNEVTCRSSSFSPPPLLLLSLIGLSEARLAASPVLRHLAFARGNTGTSVSYALLTHAYYSMAETLEHREVRLRMRAYTDQIADSKAKIKLQLSEFPYIVRKPVIRKCQVTELPSFLFSAISKTVTYPPSLYCRSRGAGHDWARHLDDYSWHSVHRHWAAASGLGGPRSAPGRHQPRIPGAQALVAGLLAPSERWPAVARLRPPNGWSYITVPDKESLVNDSGKLSVLDALLKRLKEGGHRVLIYSQMTKMIDLLEEYMCHRQHKYMRLDGSSKISERRDMVADFQAHSDYFVFLLSTRAGGLGINLTAADTVIFYDSDWNPTVDQQAMDRAHRLGQTKQVTVYRLICKGSIEERILQRAREKSEIQKLVISGGNFKPDTLKPKEVVSLLLDDEEIEMKYRQRADERKHMEDMREVDRKRKHANLQKENSSPTSTGGTATLTLGNSSTPTSCVLSTSLSNTSLSTNLTTNSAKRPRLATGCELSSLNESYEEPLFLEDSTPTSPAQSDHSIIDDGSEIASVDVEGFDPLTYPFSNRTSSSNFSIYSSGSLKLRTPARGASKRGRPRGSKRISALGRFNSTSGLGTVAASDSLAQSEGGLDSDISSPQNRSPTSCSPPSVGPAHYYGTVGATASPTASATAATTTCSATVTPQTQQQQAGACSGGARRGPGRPRLKPGGPQHQGSRGTYRPRKPVRPLPVPLPTDPMGNVTPTTVDSSYTNYLFSVRDNSD